SSTGIVTVNLATAPSPAITDPTLVTISGSTNAQYDYSLAGKSPSVGATTIAYALPAEYPPVPPTATYTATGSAAGTSHVSNLSRNSDVGWVVATATLTDPSFGGGSNVAMGDSLVITNSVGAYYNGTQTVLSASGSSATFRIAETPNALGGAGTIGNTNGSA